MLIDLSKPASYIGGVVGGGGGGADAGFLGVFPTSAALILAYPTAAEGATAGVIGPPQNLWAYNSGAWADTGIGFEGDMLKATYDPTNKQVDVYDKANEIGVEQITGTIITPPTLTATADDYNPTGFATTNMIRQDIDANQRQITGFPAPAAGVNRVIRINNINTGGFDLRLMHNNAGSLAANRILLRDDNDKDIKPNETGALWYDHTSLRWRAYTRVG